MSMTLTSPIAGRWACDFRRWISSGGAAKELELACVSVCSARESVTHKYIQLCCNKCLTRRRRRRNQILWGRRPRRAQPYFWLPPQKTILWALALVINTYKKKEKNNDNVTFPRLLSPKHIAPYAPYASEYSRGNLTLWEIFVRKRRLWDIFRFPLSIIPRYPGEWKCSKIRISYFASVLFSKQL